MYSTIYCVPRNECSIWNTTEIETQGGESRTEKPIGHWLEGGRAASEPSNKRSHMYPMQWLGSSWNHPWMGSSQRLSTKLLGTGEWITTTSTGVIHGCWLFFVVVKATVRALLGRCGMICGPWCVHCFRSFLPARHGKPDLGVASVNHYRLTWRFFNAKN